MKFRNSLIVFALIFIAMSSCRGLDDAEYKVVKELALTENVFIVGEESSLTGIPFYSNGDVTVRFINDAKDWASINAEHFYGDDTLKISVLENTGFRRMAKLELSLNGGEKRDTVYVRQKGIIPVAGCNMPYSTVDGSKEDKAVFEIDTNLDLAAFSKTIKFISGDDGWIDTVTSEGNNVVVSTRRTDSDAIGKANISLKYIDGWDEEIIINLFITASDKYGRFGTLVSWEQARELAGKGTISEDYLLEAVVISDCNSDNMALNHNVSYNEVDVTESAGTAYVQKEDGSQGFCLKFIDPDDNILVKGTAVSINLRGLRIDKYTEPERYVISNVRADCVVKSSQGIIEKKERRISELTDLDIYTWVTLVGTEIYCKYGAYTNVFEDYALSSSINSMCSGNKNRFDGWATLLVDAYGSAIYAPVNMMCLWRRGTDVTIPILVPQGSGPTEGIIVSENNLRYGDMGRYQIRVVDESGFRQSKDGASAYTEYVRYNGQPYSYRYGQYAAINAKYAAPSGLEARMRQVIPSDDISKDKPSPNAELSCQNYAAASSLTDTNYPMASNDAYCSPFCTNDNIGKSGIASTKNDTGHPRSLILIHDIKGWYDWEDQKVSGYRGLVLETSTKDLHGQVMTLAFAFSAGKISANTSRNFPAHWCVDCSVDDGTSFIDCPDAVTGNAFVHLRSLPWMDDTISGVKYFSSGSCGLGATEHCFRLPPCAFGAEKLVIRIRPYDDVISSLTLDWMGNTESGKVSHNTVVDTFINFEYISIRYK